MSSINPNNIDGTYPIAGQDDDSQGFRDNFTNIKNNFTFAYDELTDLQSKAVLKSALTGGSSPSPSFTILPMLIVCMFAIIRSLYVIYRKVLDIF